LCQISLDNLDGLVLASNGENGVPGGRGEHMKNPRACHDVYENTSG
jgi:hypothetical protein